MGAKKQENEVLLCKLTEDHAKRVSDFAECLKENAHTIGNHGLTKSEFQQLGILESAVEKLRGSRSAKMELKRRFVADVLNYLVEKGAIESFGFTGASERHDYQVELKDGRICVIEAKGCLDGNNTNIFKRPPQADEFIIWSLCQNPGSDPRKNAWSGIHTRLGAEIIDRNSLVNGLVIWDMLCGKERPCPKLKDDASRLVIVSDSFSVPPPCLYLFPRSVPDPRNNPNPGGSALRDIGFFQALYDVFECDAHDVVSVEIEARMEGANVQRRTTLRRNKEIVRASKWTELKRAR